MRTPFFPLGLHYETTLFLGVLGDSIGRLISKDNFIDFIEDLIASDRPQVNEAMHYVMLHWTRVDTQSASRQWVFCAEKFAASANDTEGLGRDRNNQTKSVRTVAFCKAMYLLESFGIGFARVIKEACLSYDDFDFDMETYGGAYLVWKSLNNRKKPVETFEDLFLHTSRVK